MPIDHRGASPSVHPPADVAPNAVPCGGVQVAADARILFGEAEDGRVEVGERTAVMENALVRGRRALAAGATFPSGWIAAGDPAQLFSPDRHAALWAVQEPLDFPGTVYALPRDAPARERMTRQSACFAAHRNEGVQ